MVFGNELILPLLNVVQLTAQGDKPRLVIEKDIIWFLNSRRSCGKGIAKLCFSPE